ILSSSATDVASGLMWSTIFPVRMVAMIWDGRLVKVAKDALSKSYVRREPRVIRSGEQRQDRNSNAAGANATSPQTQRREDRTGGDMSVYGFWSPDTECVFDVRVTDPSAKSNRKKDPRKLESS
ncbi:hypothetical protein THAOC_24965, partial [Thalassiosira oceanica]